MIILFVESERREVELRMEFIIWAPRLRPAKAFNAVVAGSDKPCSLGLLLEEEEEHCDDAKAAGSLFRFLASEEEEEGDEFLRSLEESWLGLLVGDDVDDEEDDDDAFEGKISTALKIFPLLAKKGFNFR